MRKVAFLFYFFYFGLLLCISSEAQTPYQVIHYTRQNYNGGSQNWSIDMDKRGYIYVANNNGLLVYDRVKWKLYRDPLTQTIIRSVAVGNDGLIYTGSYEDFGFWKEDKSHKLVYHSLKSLLGNFHRPNFEIWKIVLLGSKVYFQGFSSLFVYDGTTLKSIPLPVNIVFLLKANNRLFVQAVEGRLYEIINDKLSVIDDKESLRNTEVKAIVPFGQNKMLIGTSSQGVFEYDGKTISPWNIPANAALKEFQINNAISFNKILITI